jgi:recombination protein RecA
VKAGIVEKSGAWFSFDSERIGQGRENAKAYLKEHPETAQRIERAIRQNAGLLAGQILEGGGGEASGGDEGSATGGPATGGLATGGFAEGDGVTPLSGSAARRGKRGA